MESPDAHVCHGSLKRPASSEHWLEHDRPEERPALSKKDRYSICERNALNWWTTIRQAKIPARYIYLFISVMTNPFHVHLFLYGSLALQPSMIYVTHTYAQIYVGHMACMAHFRKIVTVKGSPQGRFILQYTQVDKRESYHSPSDSSTNGSSAEILRFNASASSTLSCKN